MSATPTYHPTQAEIDAYMAQHQVSHEIAKIKLIEAHLQQNTSH